ncbi:MAG: tyrosine--tRNA ligase [Candidatus Edwardsbacteria bacterium]
MKDRRQMDITTQLEFIKKGTAEIVPEAELFQKLEEAGRQKKALRIKLGVDPSSPHIHLGNAVVIRKLRDFQQLGHQVVFIVGDFTGRIGDPSGRAATRRQLSEEEVKTNMATYKEQVGRILDVEKTEFRCNSEWLGRLTPFEIVKICSFQTVARMLERDDFSIRFKESRPIGIHEFLYPLFQGYDSVAIRADVELGGTEQKFNLLLGRELQIYYGQKPQVAVTMPILVGIDGVKRMGKSLSNYVGITESPKEIFGKIMSIPDNIIVHYFELATEISSSDLEKIKTALSKGENPRNFKARLGKEIVSLYHGKAAAEKAELEFDRIFKEKGLPEKIEEYRIEAGKKIWLVRLLVETGLVKTNSDARRLIQQGAVEIDGEMISDIEKELSLKKPIVIKVGKRRFLKIVPK